MHVPDAQLRHRPSPGARRIAAAAWWPIDDTSAFGGEQMTISLAGVDAQQALSGGSFSVGGIPPGVAKVQFDKFYDDVRAEIERRTNIGQD